MQKVRCLLCAALLTFVLAASAFAGDMQTPGITNPPPPPPPDGLRSVATSGEMNTDDLTIEDGVLSDLLIEVLLSVF
jgi:hypothetical protein